MSVNVPAPAPAPALLFIVAVQLRGVLPVVGTSAVRYVLPGTPGPVMSHVDSTGTRFVLTRVIVGLPFTLVPVKVTVLVKYVRGIIVNVSGLVHLILAGG